ncbi:MULTISPECIES: hypothetical protein [Streptomyces]|uniref:Peptidase n=1 Tax=Streptomyces evansiae TaxID=3075535 RepID=A0ABU2R7G5_9ACTN|nr:MULTISPECIES: hypothetical protein [unclassified Streptomyces]MDT0412201.1 hypothetical protein [Streptomyces sp. DSM 41979]MYQ56161.1 hypothetical protein [Streptomyces sp. SID4926]
MPVRPHAPRTRGVLLALAACLTGVVPLGTAPAAAAEPHLTAPATYHIAPPGGPKRPARDKRLHVSYDGDAVAGRKTGRLIMDVSGAADVLRLKKFGNGCSGDRTRIVCAVGASYNSWADWAGALPYAAPGSKAGDAGDLRMRYEAPGGKVSEATTRVVVGGPVLEIRRPEKVAHLRPGARTPFAFVVRNAGETPAHGLGLTYTTDAMTPTTERFSNCRYHAATAVCRFPALDLASGESVDLAPGLDLRAPKTETAGSLYQSAWPLDLGPYEGVVVPDEGEPGKGPALRPEPGKGTTGTWSDEDTAWTHFSVDNPSDYAAVGTRVPGGAGEERDVRIGATNNGPGDPGQNSPVEIRFTPPQGARVLKEPMEELDEDYFEPLCTHDKAGVYTCPLTVHEPGDTQRLAFRLRLGTASGDGSVRLRGRGGKEYPADPEPANDKAAVTVMGAGPGASGESHAAAWWAGGGAAVVVAGALVLWARGRRSRAR